MSRILLLATAAIGGRCSDTLPATGPNAGPLPPGAWYAVGVSASGRVVAAGQDAPTPQPLMLSYDGGASFAPVTTLTTGNWRSIALSETGQVIAAAPALGTLHVSHDFGLTWVAVGPSLEWYAIATSSDGKTMVATGWGAPVVVSNTAGLTWTTAVPFMFGVAVGMTPSADFMIALNHSAVPADALVSRNSGTTFTAAYSGARLRGVAVSADGSTVAIARNGGYGLVISHDGGRSFTASAAGVNMYSVAMRADAQHLLVANQGGTLQRSLDGGATWTNTLSGFVSAWCSTAISPSGGLWIALDCTGTNHMPGNGSAWFSTDNGETWRQGSA